MRHSHLLLLPFSSRTSFSLHQCARSRKPRAAWCTVKSGQPDAHPRCFASTSPNERSLWLLCILQLLQGFVAVHLSLLSSEHLNTVRGLCRYKDASGKRCLKLHLTDGAPWLHSPPCTSVNPRSRRDTHLAALLSPFAAGPSAGVVALHNHARPEGSPCCVCMLISHHSPHPCTRSCMQVVVSIAHAGVQTFWAVELHTIAPLTTNLSAGTKVRITNPAVRRGTVMLMTGCLEVLGGRVPLLEDARLRLRQHWNQPVGCSLLTVQARLSRFTAPMAHAAGVLAYLPRGAKGPARRAWTLAKHWKTLRWS